MIKFTTLPKTTLELIAEAGITYSTSKRIDGGGYNNLFLRTKDCTYLVSPSRTLVLNELDNNNVEIIGDYPTVCSVHDFYMMEWVERGIHDNDVTHRPLDITIGRCRPDQLRSVCAENLEEEASMLISKMTWRKRRLGVLKTRDDGTKQSRNEMIELECDIEDLEDDLRQLNVAISAIKDNK